ncbi:LamG-like jellyroll fold domain-containing protein [uncultured Christiangramia sp.]|uniref:LamG-like jellyroll fold domain-containing protein n=1 Tax=uncultured Christiangramia sp. TaxID=503836 RepID=UPI00261BD765|nr:LamG-like jellyroll fold domain-containing protein [uncultured Christiangramia sp.]
MKQITIGPQLQFVLFSLLFFFSSVVLDGSELHAQTINANSTNPTCENSADGSITINVSGGTSPYTYNWTGTGVSTSAQNQSNLTQGSYTVEVTDSSEPAQSTSKTFTLNAVDNEDPVVQTKNITIQLDATGNASITTSDIDNGSSDNCAIDSISLSKTIFDCNDIGSNSVTLTVSDKFGNSSSKTATINVEDNIAPIVQTKNITIQLDASGNASISDDAVNNNSTDACSSISFDTDITDFNCSNIGANSVTLTVTDEDGNSASKDATVTVEDDIAPNAIAQNITVQLDASGNASITAAEVDNGSSDNCGIKDLSLDITSFDCSNVGANNVVLTVTDVNNNSSTANATVTVEDNIAPNAIAQNITVQLDASGNASITAAEVDNGSTDNCGISNFSLDQTNFDCEDVGSNPVTLTVTDVNGNSATGNATVTLEDNINPETPVLEDLLWYCGREITDYPTTSDNCETIITGTTNDPLQYSGYGNYQIIWTFTDSSGNSANATQNIIIPEPTVDIPAIDAAEFCNEETVPTISFSHSDTYTLENKSYEWSYTTNQGNLNIGLDQNGTGNIPEFVAVNNGSEIIDVTFTVIPFGNDCEGDPVFFGISIKPTPTMTKPDDIVICAGESTENIRFPNNFFSVSGSSNTWSNDNTAIGLGSGGNGNIGRFTAENDTDESIFATITVTPSANGCEGVAQTFQVEVRPKPEITVIGDSVIADSDFPSDLIFCNGESTTALPLLSNVTGTKFNISGGVAIGLSDRTNVTQIPSFTTKTGSATITITPVALACIGEAVSFDVTVNPTPSVSVNPGQQSICSGETTAIALSGSADTYSWTISEIGSNITGASEGSGNQIAQTLTNTGTQSQVVKFKVIPEANGCTGTPITATVTVNPIPDFEVTVPECETSVDLTDPSIKTSAFSNLTYTYYTDAGATTEVSSPSNVGEGNYYIKGETNNGCFVVKEVVVDKISPLFSSPIEGLETCSNNIFDYTADSNLEGTTFSWTRPEVQGIENPADVSNDENGNNPNEILINTTQQSVSVIYEFTLTSPSGCTKTQQITVLVKPSPELVDKSYTDQLCAGDKFNYHPESTLANTTFRWERRDAEGNVQATGTGPINENLNNETDQTKIYTYFYRLSTNNCENLRDYPITVSVLKEPFEVEASASSYEICQGESINLFSNANVFQEIDETVFSTNFSNLNGWQTSNAGSATWQIVDNRYVQSNRFNLNENTNLRHNFLISSNFSTVGYESLTLDLRHFYDDAGANWGDSALIIYSVDGGNSYFILEEFETDQRDGNGFTNYVRDISDLRGYNNVRIGFSFYNDGNNARGYIWAIDNIEITGTQQDLPEIEWTSDTDPNWTSNEQNPQNVTPNVTTTYTVRYTDPDIANCPGIETVEVIVRNPPEPTITANYCGDSQFIELISDNEYSSYRWEANGEVLGTSRNLDVDIAKTYTLTVTDDLGCEGTGYINVSNELIVNGDFEDGVTGFYTEYRNKTNNGDLYPEGDFAVDDDAHDYHNNFYGRDHTTGNGNFMIINGHPGSGKVIWRQTIENIQPNTNYYFNAWGMNVNPENPARLQFRVNGVNTGTIADLRDAPKPTSNGQVNRGNWVQFYSNPFWNSGNSTTAVLEIVNLETIRSGNDFALDDISFGTLEQIVFEINPENNSAVCVGDQLELYANIEGGRFPITFEWTGPNGSDFYEKITVNTLEELNAAETIIIPNATPEMNGTFTLEVTDFYGCTPQTGSTEVSVIQIDAGEDITICSSETELQLNGTITGSTEGATWSTDGSGTFSDVNALDAVYIFSENDILNGVMLTLSSSDTEATCSSQISIDFFNSPELSITSTNTTCFAIEDGSATVEVTPNTGLPPYTYEWIDGETLIGSGKTIDNLAPNENGYTVMVTDANGCTGTITSDPILEPSALEIVSIETTDATCFGEASGFAVLEVTGGFITDETPGYVLSILNNTGEEVLSQTGENNIFNTGEILEAGVYTFTAKTVTGCNLLTENITIGQPDEIVINEDETLTAEECGVTRFQLTAQVVDPNLGVGRWDIISPTNTSASIEDVTSPNTWFNGEANTIYEVSWIVTPANDLCGEISNTVTIEVPSTCSKLDFDGVDDHINVGSNFSMGGKNFSLEAWIKPHNVTGVKTIISKRREGDNNIGYDLFLNQGVPTFRVRNRSVSGTKKVDTDRWYHIAAVYSASRMTLYVDGIEIQNNTNNIPGGSGNFDAPFIIGAAYTANNISNTKEHFNGFIEEVRIWEDDISKQQIQFFMNQRLQKTGNQVEGTILDNSLNLTNAPESPSWNTLVGYYQLLAEENLITDGSTPNLGSVGNSAAGLLKNIQSLQQNTAPLPYISNNDGNWDTMNTWLRPDVWDSPNSKGINEESIDWNIVLTSHDIKNSNRNISLLGLISENGTIEFEGSTNARTGMGSGYGLLISHYLKLDGVIDLNGESQLVQPEGSILDPLSSGNLQIDQQGKANSYNYNYWTSPVSNANTSGVNNGFSLNNVLYNGSNPFIFRPNFAAADGNDIVLSSYWLYTFSGEADDYFTWLQFDETFKLEPGIGYSMKGTSGAADLNVHQNYTFRGMPNNGDISVAVGEDQNLLTGNPYPSAIDSEKFIEENAIQQQNFNGSLYFWDHFGKIDSHYLEEYVGGYAVLNKSGSVSSASSIDSRIQTETDLRGSKKPGRYIPVGQGFFINTQGASNPQQITFKNKYRVFVPESSGDSQFHSQEEDPKKSAENEYEKDTRHKVRLKLESPKGYHRQILATADVNTTDGFDLGYDAPLIENNVEDLYWMIDESEFVIQGVPDFNKARVLPIGFKIAEAGEYTIKIDELENIQNDIDIYLLDTTNEEYHDLMKSDYTVSTDSVGVFNEKYQIVFQKLEEEVSEEVVEEKPEVVEESDPDFLDMRYLRQTDEIALYNPDLQNIDFVELYSVSGQKIMTFSEIPTEESISLRIQQKLSSAVYVVKIYVGEKSYSKKVIITK